MRVAFVAIIGPFRMKLAIFCLPTYCLPICCILLCGPVRAQMLVVDRGIDSTAQSALIPINSTQSGFFADVFKVGALGEVWIIDAIRTWAPATSGEAGDAFEKLAIVGGIEANPQPPDQPPQPECDCHN